MTTALTKLRTLASLGLGNVARVGAYRLGLKLGIHPVLKAAGVAPDGPFYTGGAATTAGLVASRAWLNEALYFSRHPFPLAGAPDWHANPFRPGARAEAAANWWQIADFDPALGDVKAVWEASRFDWLPAMAQRASLGDEAELVRLNAWLADWSHRNPPFRGVNWKCGQEASIRVLHLALAAVLLGENADPPAGLVALVQLHLDRIAPTMGYAIGQQNNHGTSEAAALFVGGSWLASLGQRSGSHHAETGRRWLEERGGALIAEDGTFSQYSAVYHRLMLDTYCLCEAWRRTMRLPAFGNALYDRLRAATLWLQELVEPSTGDVPNLGANDGARLMQLADVEFRDFRPSLQLASLLFFDARAIREAGPWDQPGLWLGLPPATQPLAPPRSVSLDDGGLHVMRRGAAVAYLRYPRFRFRPSQADALHLDLWIGPDNLLRDAGTYSYAEPHPEAGDLARTCAHNTVTFDGRDQMPRLGRFLFGSWLRAEHVMCVREESAAVIAAAGYTDDTGARHHRSVRLEPRQLTCVDVLAGRAREAVLRWRLRPGQWHQVGHAVTDGQVHIAVSCDRPIQRMTLVRGYESRHYLEVAELPVIEIACEVPSTVTTEISF